MALIKPEQLRSGSYNITGSLFGTSSYANFALTASYAMNGGVVDTSYPIDWLHYRNCILLTQHNELSQLNTKIYKIIDL